MVFVILDSINTDISKTINLRTMGMVSFGRGNCPDFEFEVGLKGISRMS